MTTTNTKNTTTYQTVFVLFVTIVLFVVSSGAANAQERIAEILVHGNHTTPNEDILALAGLALGGEASEAALAQAQERLERSGRFEAVEVRRRFRSISNSDEILVILLVDERVRGAGLWMPIVTHRDGYGFTYGARVSFQDPLGPRTRLSVPLTWGGERRAAVEVERTFQQGPLTLVGGSLSITRRVNPHYDEVDLRREFSVRAERAITPWLRAGADARVSQVTFGSTTTDRVTTDGVSGFSRTSAGYVAGGGHLTIDTRQDASFPRDAIHTTIGFERLENSNRLLADARGYIGVIGPAVVALRGQAAIADASLPASEQPLVGGADSLRGYRAGYKAGDNMMAFSAEVRVPLTSPLSVGRFGVKAFVDTATSWSEGQSLRDQRFDRGAGAGIFMGAAIVSLGADVAWPERGKARVTVELRIGN